MHDPGMAPRPVGAALSPSIKVNNYLNSSCCIPFISWTYRNTYFSQDSARSCLATKMGGRHARVDICAESAVDCWLLHDLSASARPVPGLGWAAVIVKRGEHGATPIRQGVAARASPINQPPDEQLPRERGSQCGSLPLSRKRDAEQHHALRDTQALGNHLRGGEVVILQASPWRRRARFSIGHHVDPVGRERVDQTRYRCAGPPQTSGRFRAQPHPPQSVLGIFDLGQMHLQRGRTRAADA
jgi:hypothetical protein